MNGRNPRPQRRVDYFKSAGQQIDNRDVGQRVLLHTAHVQSHVDRISEMSLSDGLTVFVQQLPINFESLCQHLCRNGFVKTGFDHLEKRARSTDCSRGVETQRFRLRGKIGPLQHSCPAL